jgi:hypothetical protein
MCRFTIRELFMLTAIVALALAWVIDRSQLASSNHELTTQRNRLADTNAQFVINASCCKRKRRQSTPAIAIPCRNPSPCSVSRSAMCYG